MITQESEKMNKRAKICAIGISKEISKILSELERRCNVEFILKKELDYGGKDALDYAIQTNPDAYEDDTKNNEILKYIEENKEDLDGIFLLQGPGDKRFFLTGLPTIFVDYNAFPNLQIRFKDTVALAKRYGTKFISATYSTYDASESVSVARFDDLVEKVKLFNVIRSMKDTKIMDVQVKGFGAEPHEHWWRLNQELYLKKLKEYSGIEAIILDYRDFFKEYDKIEENKAKEIAKRWITGQKQTKAIRNKRNLGDITEKDIINGAKVYLIADKLMKKFNANAITVDSLSWALISEHKAKCYPSMSPGIAEFQLHGIPATCESDMEGTVTSVLGHYLTEGYNGLMGDFIIDPFNNVVEICHCSSPINPYGDEYKAPYSIGGERLRRPQFYVDLPEKGVATVMKVNVLEKKILVLTGEVISGEFVWKNFNESCCCTKVVVKTNAKRIYENFDHRTFGNHQVLFYGDHRKKIKDLATLIGFEVIEEDI